MSPTVAQAKSMAACKRLLAQPEFQRAGTVMIYLPMPGEVEVGPIALRGWQEGKTICAPKISWEQRHMIPMEIKSLETGLVTVRPHLLEPEGGSPVPVEMLDLVVVPAMAYDRNGNRLGRGAGFYDRFLASSKFHGKTIGLAFQEQLVDSLPVHDTDVPVDVLVTDEEILRFPPRSRGNSGKEARRQPL
jgi:5-formyltetrahydrofolate cyclo-ligase